MNYEKEFKVTAKQVKKEVQAIRRKKRLYDQHGEPVNKQNVYTWNEEILELAKKVGEDIKANENKSVQPNN